jgi:hypothetical protein
MVKEWYYGEQIQKPKLLLLTPLIKDAVAVMIISNIW